MKKILWVINPLQFREQDVAYPQYISRIMEGKLTGVFLEQDKETSSTFSTHDHMFNYSKLSSKITTDDKQQKEIALKKQVAIKTLQHKSVCVNFHQDGGIPLEDLITESRYADILLVNAGLSFIENDNQLPTLFVKNVLARAECPVLVMPEEHREINEIVFTYNGSYSSVFAIKQFTYLFSSLSNLHTTVLYAPENDADESLERKRFIAELLRSHYPKLDFKILHGNLDNSLFPEILLKTNAVVTFGGYGSNHSSRALHKSDAENAIHSISLPIFVTQATDLAPTPLRRW